MMTETLSFRHRFEPGAGSTQPPLLLLHGTGGDENDLLPLGQAVAPGAALLSPRGQVLEHGMPRFFRRLAEGVFDEEDLRRQTDALADFVLAAREAYGLPAPVALGFSNGANIAAAMLLQRPGVLRGAALLRPMVPFQASPPVKLDGVPVLLLSGATDPIVPAENSERLAVLLKQAGADVMHRLLPGGHGLTQMDVGLAKSWLAAL